MTMTTNENGDICIRVPCIFRITSGKHNLIVNDGTDPERILSSPITRAIVKARELVKKLEDGTYPNYVELARGMGIDPKAVQRAMRLAYLAPVIVDKISKGEYPDGLSLKKIYNIKSDIWTDQCEELCIKV